MQINVEFKICSAFIILFVLRDSVSPENKGQSNGGAFLVNVTNGWFNHDIHCHLF